MNELALLNEIFNDACGLALPALGAPAAVPAVDVTKTAAAYTLTMDLPGRTEQDVDITLKEDVLTIASVAPAAAQIAAGSAEAPAAAAPDAAEPAASAARPEPARWLLRERPVAGAFRRSFTLPKDCDLSAATASFKNGVLTVTLPIRAEAAAKKIAIQAA